MNGLESQDYFSYFLSESDTFQAILRVIAWLISKIWYLSSVPSFPVFWFVFIFQKQKKKVYVEEEYCEFPGMEISFLYSFALR